MRYNPPFGSTDPNAPYVDRNTPGAVAGSKVPARAIEDTQREIVRVLTDRGFVPDPSDLTQLSQAISFGFAGNVDIPVLGWLNTPPASPVIGDKYVVGPAPTGAWSNRAHRVAIWLGAWTFILPVVGLQANYVEGSQFKAIFYNGTRWSQIRYGFTGATQFPNVGTVNWTVPDGVSLIKVCIWGGGGGGGGSSNSTSAGAGGGSGAYGEGIYPVTPGQVLPVTVGAGGAGGGNPAGSGGTSSVGSLISCTGGSGGQGGTSGIAANAGSGGTATGANFINLPGKNGSVGLNTASGIFFGGCGAGTYACPPTLVGQGEGQAGQGVGGGGGGAAASNSPGGAGTKGLVTIEF